MGAAGQDAGGAQQVVGDGCAEDPGTVGAETPRRQVRQGSVDEVCEHGFDNGVLAVGDVGLGGGRLGVGQKRVVPPYGEQRLEVVGVLDPAHDQAGGDRLGSAGEGGVGDLGDLGIQDSSEMAAMARWTAALRVMTSENSAP